MTDTSIHTPTDEERETLAKLIDKAKIGVITTISADGSLVSRPMQVQEREFDGDLWFFTEDPSHKTDEVRDVPEVNVSFQTSKGWVSIAGTASVVKDPAKIDEFWSTSAQAWFKGGREDPKVALLKVNAHTAEYWTQDDPTPVLLLKYARAALGGGQPHIGSATTVSLDD